MKSVFFNLIKTTCLPALAALCLLASPAEAMPGAGKEDAPKVDKFAQMDANKDGKVVYEEFKAVFPTMREEAFTVIDKNGDKAIDRGEWDAFVQDHSSGHMGGQAGGKMGGMSKAPGDAANPAAGCPALPLVTPPNGK